MFPKWNHTVPQIVFFFFFSSNGKFVKLLLFVCLFKGATETKGSEEGQLGGRRLVHTWRPCIWWGPQALLLVVITWAPVVGIDQGVPGWLAGVPIVNVR